jgi:DNA-binding LacI/PurR family transcriptional regulator
MKVTHQQIAEKVGVSRTVVTHVLHRTPHARIGSETRAAILAAAQELGYQPRDRATHAIGYVMSVSQMRLEAETSQLMHFEQSLRARGYRLTLASWQADNPEALREAFNAKTVDGIIFNTWGDGLIKSIPAPGMPWILLSDEDGVDDDVDLVALDARETSRRVTAHLIERGHSRLGLIVHLAGIRFHRRIIEGAQIAVRKAGLNPRDLRLIRPYHIEEIAGDLLPIMARPDSPTALIATSPGIAITTLYSLRCAGYEVPGDVSVAAILDSERYRALSPVMTATDGLGREFVERAVSRLIEKIENRQSTSEQTFIAGNLIERDSVGEPASKIPIVKTRLTGDCRAKQKKL